MNDLRRLEQKVGQIYDWLNEQIEADRNPAFCKACGRCCDFAKFDHLLFVTTPELIFLKENLKPQKIKTMPAAVCPYNEKGRCTIYPLRFAGCRIFFCNPPAADKDFQSRLSESAVSRFKSLCTEFNISYIYSDLQTALNVNLQQLKCRF
jgi:Fe-S-cluster containining protein